MRTLSGTLVQLQRWDSLSSGGGIVETNELENKQELERDGMIKTMNIQKQYYKCRGGKNGGRKKTNGE